MDNEIAEIRRRAGLTEQGEVVADVATFERLNEFLTDEIEFLGKLGQVLGRTMAPDRARQLLAVIGDRRQKLEQFGRQAQAQARQEQSKSRQGPQAKRQGEANPYQQGGGVGGNVDTRA